jgi:hypothetical protein
MPLRGSLYAVRAASGSVLWQMYLGLKERRVSVLALAKGGSIAYSCVWDDAVRRRCTFAAGDRRDGTSDHRLGRGGPVRAIGGARLGSFCSVFAMIRTAGLRGGPDQGTAHGPT